MPNVWKVLLDLVADSVHLLETMATKLRYGHLELRNHVNRLLWIELFLRSDQVNDIPVLRQWHTIELPSDIDSYDVGITSFHAFPVKSNTICLS